MQQPPPRRPTFPARIPSSDPPTLVSPKPKPVGGVTAARVATLPITISSAAQASGSDSAAAMRTRMVQRLAAGGITATAVLQAMAAVERHRFVDSALVNQAYEDTSLPIGLGQTISKPSVVARMAQLLLGAPGNSAGAGLGRILEIGTGCGYQAAVLGRIAREVYSMERLRALHERARVNLRPLRLTNVHLIFGDGMLGYPQGAPYAAIIAAAGGEDVPAAWCDQLAIGGRLVAPIAQSAGRQMLLVIDKTAQGFQESVLEAVHFVPLKSGVA